MALKFRICPLKKRGGTGNFEALDTLAELVWGMNDPILARGLPVMQSLFPAAPVTETEAGHFLQEEVPDVIAAAIMRIVDAVQKK